MMMKRNKIFLIFLTGMALLSGCDQSPVGNEQTQTAEADAIAQTAIAGLLAEFTQTSEALATITQMPGLISAMTATSLPVAPTEASQITPLAVATAVATAEPLEVAKFVSETIPDDTEISPGDIFTKSWVLQNSGETTWTASYMLVFVHGDQMGGPNWQQIGQRVLPGEQIKISVNLTAPLNPGTYAGYWKLSDPSGSIFGVEPNGTGAFYVQISVPYADTKTPTVTQTEVTNTQTPAPTATVEPTANGG